MSDEMEIRLWATLGGWCLSGLKDAYVSRVGSGRLIVSLGVKSCPAGFSVGSRLALGESLDSPLFVWEARSISRQARFSVSMDMVGVLRRLGSGVYLSSIDGDMPFFHMPMVRSDLGSNASVTASVFWVEYGPREIRDIPMVEGGLGIAIERCVQFWNEFGVSSFRQD